MYPKKSYHKKFLRMESSSTFIVSDEDESLVNAYPFIGVKIGDEVHTLHNPYVHVPKEMRPFRNWMRCMDDTSSTYEKKFDDLVRCIRSDNETFDVKNVMVSMDTLRNSRNRSNGRCLKEILQPIKVDEYTAYVVDGCMYSLEKLFEGCDGELITGVIQQRDGDHVDGDNRHGDKYSGWYKFKVVYVSFGGIVRRRVIEGMYRFVKSGRYDLCV